MSLDLEALEDKRLLRIGGESIQAPDCEPQFKALTLLFEDDITLEISADLLKIELENGRAV